MVTVTPDEINVKNLRLNTSSIEVKNRPGATIFNVYIRFEG